MKRKRRQVQWRKLHEAVDTTVNALREMGLPANQCGAARDMILLIVQWYDAKNAKYWF